MLTLGIEKLSDTSQWTHPLVSYLMVWTISSQKQTVAHTSCNPQVDLRFTFITSLSINHKSPALALRLSHLQFGNCSSIKVRRPRQALCHCCGCWEMLMTHSHIFSLECWIVHEHSIILTAPCKHLEGCPDPNGSDHAFKLLLLMKHNWMRFLPTTMRSLIPEMHLQNLLTISLSAYLPTDEPSSHDIHASLIVF